MRGCVDLVDQTVIFLCRDCRENYGTLGCGILRTISNTKVVNGIKENSGEEIKFMELIQNKIIYSDNRGELRGWEQQNNTIVLFAGDPNTENVEDYLETLQFPKAAIPRLIAFLGRVKVPCAEARGLFSVAWEASAEKHAEAYADYLEHLTSCKECITTFGLTDEDIERIKHDVLGYKKGAEEMRKERTR